MATEKETTVYGWAFYTGKKIIEQLEKLYENPDSVEKRFVTLYLLSILTLNSQYLYML